MTTQIRTEEEIVAPSAEISSAEKGTGKQAENFPVDPGELNICIGCE